MTDEYQTSNLWARAKTFSVKEKQLKITFSSRPSAPACQARTKSKIRTLRTPSIFTEYIAKIRRSEKFHVASIITWSSGVKKPFYWMSSKALKMITRLMPAKLCVMARVTCICHRKQLWGGFSAQNGNCQKDGPYALDIRLTFAVPEIDEITFVTQTERYVRGNATTSV